jgi:class 3 adenylate cyclase
MLRALDACNDELAKLESPPLSIRIGVASGELIQGNMGSAIKLEYTVIGDIVNVASRLEGKASPNHALVAAPMLEHVSDDELDRLRVGEEHPILVKGRRGEVSVIEIALGDP